MLLRWINKYLRFESGFISSWFVVVCVLVYLVVVIARKLVLPVLRNYRLGNLLCELCGTDGDKHWFYGHTRKYGFNEASLYNIVERSKTFPSTFCRWIGPFLPQVEVYHPGTLIPALAKSTPKSELGYRFLRPWIGDGLLTSHGKKWQRNRRLLTPAFHYNILKPYLKVFNDCAKTMIRNWEKHVGNPIEISERISLMTLDAMLRCAMSLETDCQSVKGRHPYIEAVNKVGDAVATRIENPFYLLDWVFYKTSHGKKFKESLNVLHEQAEKIIAERRKALSETGLKRETNKEAKKELDFLDILIEAKDDGGKGLTDREIRDEVDTFLFEGHDTTASGISWLLYNLAKHPEMQEKCRQEIQEVLGQKENVGWEDLSNIPYSLMFIKESMRLYPPVPVIARYLTSPLSLRKNLTIPPECNIALHIFACHRNEHVWENPERFDPERFTLENISKRSSHAFIPFSAGPRNCIGQNFAMNEIKVVLCQVLKRYRLYLDRDTPTPIMKLSMVLRSEKGIVLKLDTL